jgi:hypothetical protein
MDVPLPEGAGRSGAQIDLSSVTADDFARIQNHAIRRLAERVAQLRQAGAEQDGVCDDVFLKGEARYFSKGF